MELKQIDSKLDRLAEKSKSKLAEIKPAVRSSVKEYAQQEVRKAEVRIDDRIDALSKAIDERNSGSAAIIKTRTWHNLVKESNRAVASQLKGFVESNGKSDLELKLFENESHFDAFLKEASALTGSAAGIGGRTAYDPVFVALRQANPMRGLSKQISTAGTTYQFRTKSGNAGAQWGIDVHNNTAATTENMIIWNQNMVDLNCQFPIRTAALDDIDGLEGSVVFDMLAEFAQAEGQSMVSNNDQGATSLPYGGSNGLRGLNQYAGANAVYTGGTTTTSAFGTSGTGSTAGLHTLQTYDQITSNGSGVVNKIAYADLINLVNALPTQYQSLSNKFMISPSLLGALRAMVDNTGTPVFERVSPLVYDGTVGQILGYDVVVNSYLDAPTGSGVAGTTSLYPCYFGNWDKGHSIVDRLNMVLRRYSQTSPGNIVFYGEKRLATSIVDPFALVRYRSTATANN